MSRHSPAACGFAVALFVLLPTFPVHAAGEILITQAKANAGNVTPGDSPGFPVTLSLPGAYQLASNVTVPAGKDGISITAHDVTLDLNGFRIHGFGVANNGIVGTLNSATIRNGTIALFKQDGIHLTAYYHTVETVRVVGSGGYGIYVAGISSLIRDNVVASNFVGISSVDALIQGNVVVGNANAGITARRSTILGNTIASNGSYGIAGGRPHPHGLHPLSGYGNNTLVNNNGNGAQVIYAEPLHPNACNPAC
jgi:hypothetical protein